MIEVRRVRDQNFRYAADLRGLTGDFADVRSGDQRMDLAEFGGGGDGRQGRVADCLAVVLDQDQHAHFAIPMPCSRSTSSSTDPTLIPAWRFAGSTTRTISMRRAMST